MNIPERMREESLTAEEFLDKQNYTKEVKLPNGSKVEPSFGRTTVTRLMKEFAEEAVADACKKQRLICADELRKVLKQWINGNGGVLPIAVFTERILNATAPEKERRDAKQ